MWNKTDCIFVYLFLAVIHLYSAPMDTGFRKLKQPNGVEFIGRTYGDEFEHRSITSTEYIYVRDRETGWYYYAVLDAEGDYMASRARVGIDTPPASKKLERSEQCKAKKAKKRNDFNITLAAAEEQAGPLPNHPHIGILLVEFQNVPHGSSPNRPNGYTLNDFYNFFFPVGMYKAPMTSPDGQAVFGSVHDYYGQMSRGIVSFTGEIINEEDLEFPERPRWVTVPYSKSYCDGLGYDPLHFETTWPGVAIVAAENQIHEFDRSNYDKIVVLFAETPGDSTLWPATTAPGGKYYWMSEQFGDMFAGIGIHCHELGHALFCFHDQYDNSPVNATEKPQPGFESYEFFGIMANGDQNGPPESPYSAPAPVEPIFRVRKGWVKPITVQTGQSLPSIMWTDNDSNPIYYRLFTQFCGDSNESSRYYILENRQRTDPYDKYCSENEEGILVWQKYSTDVYFDLIEADDNWNETGNYFPGSTNTMVFIGDGGGGFYIRGKSGPSDNYIYTIDFFGNGYNWNMSTPDRAMLSGEIAATNLTFSNEVYLMAGTHLKFNTGGQFSVVNGGRLIANTFPEFPLIMEGNNTTWSGVFLSGSNNSGIVLKYLKIKDVLTYGGAALTLLNCDGDTIRNSEIFNNGNYGTSGISLFNAGEPNIHHNVIHDNGGYGIKFQNASGNFWANSVINNTYGSVYAYNYASPRFFFPGIPAYQGGTTLSGGYYSVYASYGSNPFLGSQLDSYYYGSNLLLNTMYYRIVANNYCDILAELNWFGEPDPSPSWFPADETSSISYLPCLSQPPGDYESPPQLLSVQISAVRKKLHEAKITSAAGNYLAALKLIREVLRLDLQKNDMRATLSMIVDLYQQSKFGELLSMMEKEIDSNTKLTKEYKAALSQMYGVAGKKELRRELLNELTLKDDNSGTYIAAFLSKYYNDFQEGLTEEEKQEIAAHAWENTDFKEAEWLTHTFYPFLPSMIANKPRTTPKNKYQVSAQASGWTMKNFGGIYFLWIYFPDSLTGYAISDSIYKTTDRGTSWQPHSTDFFIGDAFFPVTASTWIAAYGSSGYQLTTDCGKSWKEYPPFYDRPITSFFFHDDKRGWRVEGRYIFKTTDLGEHWTISDSSATFGVIVFSNEKNGYVFCNDGFIRLTTDGGITWISRVMCTQWCLVMKAFVIDSLNIIGVGANSLITRTTDAGVTWSTQLTQGGDSYRSVYFVDNRVGWIVGRYGVIRKTTDGGATWVSQTSGVTCDLNDVYFHDRNTGWIVGGNGTILSTTTGGEPLSVPSSEVIPREFGLLQNYPNPFNPTTTMSYSLPSQQQVRLNIFNTLGQQIATLVNEIQQAGRHTLQWNGTDDNGNRVASGIYLYRLEAGRYRETKKMLLVR
jgi:photosystem II stability/assembly factor-like uncharacterized protein